MRSLFVNIVLARGKRPDCAAAVQRPASIAAIFTARAYTIRSQRVRTHERTGTREHCKKYALYLTAG